MGSNSIIQRRAAGGIGERLEALAEWIDCPAALLQEVTGDLIGASDDITVDDVLDALVLGVVASMPTDEFRYLPKDWKADSEGIPMRMAYWAQQPLKSSNAT